MVLPNITAIYFKIWLSCPQNLHFINKFFNNKISKCTLFTIRDGKYENTLILQQTSILSANQSYTFS